MSDTTPNIDALRVNEGPSSSEKAAVGTFATVPWVAGPVTSFLEKSLSDTQ